MNHAGFNPQNSAVVLIPARFNSSRLPGKPLLDLAGKPMICRVVERALSAKTVNRAIVATDDSRIRDAVVAEGFEAVLTRSDHPSGTDRLAEAARDLVEADVIVNVQGDEPMIAPQTIDAAVSALIADGESEIATTWEPIQSAADVLSRDVVKVIVDRYDHALYFSRTPIPFPVEAVRRHGSLQSALENDQETIHLFRKHTGLYVYRRAFLLEFANWPQSTLERAEQLEQLRALERGIKIKVVQAHAHSIGVDTLPDLERVRALMER